MNDDGIFSFNEVREHYTDRNRFDPIAHSGHHLDPSHDVASHQMKVWVNGKDVAEAELYRAMMRADVPKARAVAHGFHHVGVALNEHSMDLQHSLRRLNNNWTGSGFDHFSQMVIDIIHSARALADMHLTHRDAVHLAVDTVHQAKVKLAGSPPAGGTRVVTGHGDWVGKPKQK